MFIRFILKAIKPLQLLTLVMTYVMGAGLVRYIRGITDWSAFILGGVFLVCVSISFELLRIMKGLFEPTAWPAGMTFRQSKQLRSIVAAIAATFVTVASMIIITWLRAGILRQGLVFSILALLTVGGLYYYSGANQKLTSYALLFEVLFYVVIPPALAFFLHANELHRFLTMVVISLVPAFLANRLLYLLWDFSRDQNRVVETLVTRIGWENAMFYHNALILLTYFLFALIAVLGVHWFIIWPVFLTLPIGLLEIWLMERIRRGLKPLWGIMRFAAACVLLLPIYLIGFAFWVR